MKHVKFYWMDYVMFGIMFGFSAAVGIYFNWFSKKNSTMNYLQGDRQMKVFPVVISLAASTISTMSLLGNPAEVYMYGTQCSMVVLAIFIMGLIVNFTFLPVLYKLQLTSVFEYLEIRFDKHMRTIFSALFTLSTLMMLPLVVYAPSLAFSQVTGFNIHFIAATTVLICLFYTIIGGVKAVIWADTLQFMITLCTLVFVLIKGVLSVGGLNVILEKAKQGNRLEFFNLDFDPTLRNTFWSIAIGNIAGWILIVGSSQASMQRFLAVPTYSDSKKLLYVYVTIIAIIQLVLHFLGMIVYAKYDTCDPLTAGYIKKADQIIPYFIADVAMEIPGLSGLFICGLFTTALGALSTYLHAVSVTIYSDIVILVVPAAVSANLNIILKLITLLLGIIIYILVFVVERLGTILQMVISVSGISGGPLVGLYLMGLVFPFANKKGAYWGALCSTLFMAIIIIGNQVMIWNDLIKDSPRPLVTTGCNTNNSIFNTTTGYSSINITELSNITEEKNLFWLFTITFNYYILIGTVLTLAIGLIVSWMTRNEVDLPVDPNLLCPFVQKFLKAPNLSSSKACDSTVERNCSVTHKNVLYRLVED